MEREGRARARVSLIYCQEPPGYSAGFLWVCVGLRYRLDELLHPGSQGIFFAFWSC